MTPDPHDPTTWARILRCDLQSHAYVAEHADWPGAAVFSHPDVDGFNLAVLQQTSPDQADALLARLTAHYHALGVTPRVRVTPLSEPADSPACKGDAANARPCKGVARDFSPCKGDTTNSPLAKGG